MYIQKLYDFALSTSISPSGAAPFVVSNSALYSTAHGLA